jgi:hypothetical protein
MVRFGRKSSNSEKKSSLAIRGGSTAAGKGKKTKKTSKK